MTCFLTFLKYPLEVLAQTPATCILMYCNAFSLFLLPFVASNSGKRYWDWTLPRIRAQIELFSTFVYDYKMSTIGSSAKNFAPHPGGTIDNDAHTCEPNHIPVQNKIIAKILPVNKFTTLKFLSLLPSMNGWFFSWLSCFALQYMFIQIGSQRWASLPFIPPGWGANSSQSCRSCSFSCHKQRCWTVLSELRCKVAYNPNTYFLNWKQRIARKAVEDALQYIKMYVAGVWTKTAKGYYKNVEEEVIRLQSKVWSNL